MKKLGLRKTLSLVITLVMLLGMLPLGSAMAYGASDQIALQGGTTLYNEKGVVVQNRSSAWVAVSKTIASNGPENEFSITLDVKTRMDVENDVTPSDASVVLVLDMSGSMYRCAECGSGSSGSYGTHANSCSHYNRNNNTITENQTRFAAVRSAAADFINTFADDSGKADRYVGIVLFGSSGVAQQISGTYWVNVSTAAGKAAVLNYLSTLKAFTNNNNTATNGYYTSIESGLAVARNLYIKSGTGISGNRVLPIPAGGAIENNNVVLFTDGDANRSGNHSTSSTSLSLPSNGNGNTTYAQSRANEIKNGATTGSYPRYSASLYAVAYAESTIDTLKTICGSENVFAATTKDLPIIFENISKTITTFADAWVVSDPMGDHIVWNSDNILNSNQKFEGNELSWDLKEQSGQKIVGGDYAGWFQYSYTYKVTLDNLYTGFTSATQLLTNGVTTLDYYIVKNGENLTKTPVIANFTVPKVKGFTGAFDFTKRIGTASDSKVYHGATFTLTEKAAPNRVAGIATSNGSGEVKFTGIPSGHNYILSETRVDIGGTAALSTKTYEISVNYGVVTVVSEYDGTFFIKDGNKIFLNDYDPKPGSITVTKIWQVPDSLVSNLPTITFTLAQKIGSNDWAYYGTYTMTKSANATADAKKWQYTISDLPMVDRATGASIAYKVSGETDLPGYTTNIDGYSITNTAKDTTDITVNKVWIAPTDKKVPVTFVLYANGEATEHTITLPQSDSWSYTFTDLDAFDGSGQYITYTVVEATELTGFDDPNEGDASNNFTITNKISQDYITINGTKVWVDGGIVYEGEVTINLYADNGDTAIATTTLAEDNTFTFEGTFPKYAEDGHEIVYTVSDSVGGYTTTDIGTAGNGYVITNTLDQEYLTFGGSKTWVDSNNEFGTRPTTGDPIEFGLFANGATEPVAIATVYPTETDVLDDDNEPTGEVTYSWSDFTFSFVGSNDELINFPKYDDERNEIIYTIEEITKIDLYAATIADTDEDGVAEAVTNTLNGDEVSVTVVKNWRDPYTDEQRAELGIKAIITVTGKVNGTAVEGDKYTATVTTSVDGYTNTRNMPKYIDGQEIVYSAAEADIEGYTTSTDGSSKNNFVFTNTIEPGSQNLTVTKIWDDELNPELRPVYTISLRADGRTVESVQTNAMTGTEDENIFTATFTVPIYGEDGQEIIYTISESAAGIGAIYNRYTASFDPATPLTVTNTFNNGERTVSGVKIWIYPTDGTLPESITVRYQGDDDETNTGYAVVTAESALENGNWSYSFEGLKKYNDTTGREIRYTITEDSIEGFTGRVLRDRRTIVNISDNPLIPFTVEKNWVGPKGGPVTVQLFRNGEPMPSSAPELSADNDWKYTFEELPKYDRERNAYQYSVQELDSQGNALKNGAEVVFGDHTYTVTYSASGLITNTVNQEYIEVLEGLKVWDAEGVNLPESITVALFADGAQVFDGETAVTTTVTPNDEGEWVIRFTNLPVYNAEGKEIKYTFREVKEGKTIDEGGMITLGGRGFIVNYSYDEELGLVIKNTYEKNYYSYQVIRNYTRIVDGVRGATNTVTGTVTPGIHNEGVTIITDFYKGNDSGGIYSSYGYVSGTLDGTTLTSMSFTLEKAGNTYVVVLNYELTETTVPEIPEIPLIPNIPVSPIDRPEIPSFPSNPNPPEEETVDEINPPLDAIVPPDDEEIIDQIIPKTGDVATTSNAAFGLLGAGLAGLGVFFKSRKKDEDAE
ncbi:MAG: Cna B-type domain-containing protein [Oscillospiraceae bacterium]|jgi:LPXTG-motif cell wall-anchored protein|nr:Cna B-type domain-containing protein [Oscillospiraceae bacterium]